MTDPCVIPTTDAELQQLAVEQMLGPKSITNADGVSATFRDVDEIQKAVSFARGTIGSAGKKTKMIFQKLEAPGAA